MSLNTSLMKDWKTDGLLFPSERHEQIFIVPNAGGEHSLPFVPQQNKGETYTTDVHMLIVFIIFFGPAGKLDEILCIIFLSSLALCACYMYLCSLFYS